MEVYGYRCMLVNSNSSDSTLVGLNRPSRTMNDIVFHDDFLRWVFESQTPACYASQTDSMHATHHADADAAPVNAFETAGDGDGDAAPVGDADGDAAPVGTFETAGDAGADLGINAELDDIPSHNEFVFHDDLWSWVIEASKRNIMCDAHPSDTVCVPQSSESSHPHSQ